MDALVAFLRPLPNFDVRIFSIPPENQSAPPAPSWLADRLYTMSRSRFDPFGAATPSGPPAAAADSIAALQAAGCAVLLWLAAGPDPDASPRSLATHGAFTVRLGERNQAFPFWDEVAAGAVTSTASIFWHDQSFASGRQVRRVETATDQGLFFTANAKPPLTALIRLLASLCLDIQRNGRRFEERALSRPASQLPAGEPPAYPSNFEAARFAVQKLTRSAYRRWSTRGKRYQWFIAIRPNTGGSITDPAALALTGFQEIPLPPGVEEMADPFLWEAGDRRYLLFEEVAKGRSRGRLGGMELLPDGRFSEMKIILDRPYHLSYPCVVPQNNDLFLLPETAGANRVELYRFTGFPWEMELVASPVEGVPLVDTTPIYLDGHWYFFTTTTEPFLETLLFSATRLEGPWTLHPCNPVSTSIKSSRSAGQLFWRNGRLFRPTQDCSVRYGYAITVNEVTTLTPDSFAEHQVSYIAPSWRPNLLGTHTWNESPAFQVLDGIRYTQ